MQSKNPGISSVVMLTGGNKFHVDLKFKNIFKFTVRYSLCEYPIFYC